MSIDTKEKESKTADSKLNNKLRNDLIVPSDIRNSMSKSKLDNKYLSTKPDDPPDDWSRLNFFQRARKMMALITVEPILACFVMPSVLSSLATQNLYLEKACRVNLQFDHHICDALTKRQTANYTFEEEAVQTLVASVAGWKTVLQSFLPCGILIFLGAYSDRVGQRKFCMLLPIIGEFLTSIGMIVNTYFFYELPVEVAAVTEAIFPALSGGWFTMFMGVFSYIADVTTEEQRTLRIGIVNLFYSLGVPVGAALSGILDFFDMRYVKDTMMVAFKTGPNNRRLRVIMLVVVLCVVIGPIYGEMSVMYLFTRYRFNWNEVDFSMFSTYAMCTSLVGTLFSVGVFSHVLKFDDAVIGIISSTSKILSGFMYAFATQTWHMYLAMMPLVYAPMYTTVYTATLKTFPGAFFLLGGGMTIPAVLIFLWLYLASKKHIASEKDLHDKQNEAAKDEKCEKLGHENMAFENDDKQYLKNNSASENPVLNFEHAASPSEIEIGITKSMQCTSKL
ncbi:unnamed protein product [Leptidea sinapis]|uniref:Uncharacterized protein n=1 Tax=Leptidea sinapis TaxID=189913 RepID=A0A5E4QTW5_9NEOP|nr:unnamed protein product [Leptidea sinapis]